MSDQLVSLIRTYVPILAGSMLAWVAVHWGIGVDGATSAQLTVAATAVAVAAYYGIVRVLESRWPWLGVLLGSRQQPTYRPPGE